MPQKKQFFAGLQTHSIFKRHLEAEVGEVRSWQEFFMLSYGVSDWLTIDLKAGSGNIRQRPATSDEVDYSSNFAGGYGFRLKLFGRKNKRAVLGFQHISVHPKTTHLGDIKHRAILDDWQVSLLVSAAFSKATPYLGTRWSRVDYIHWVGADRKRAMSDLTKGVGLVFGIDVPLTQNTWINLEGSILDSEAVSLGLNYAF